MGDSGKRLPPAGGERGESTYGFETRAVHAGAAPDAVTGARNTPIHHSTSYVFDDVDHAASLFNLQTFGFIYSRIGNPTVAVLEERIASLENGRAACAAGSGHAAQFLAFFAFMEPGDHFVASRNLYGGSITPVRRLASGNWAGIAALRIRWNRIPSAGRSAPNRKRFSSNPSPTRPA